jgi:hypothetical protein
MKAIKLGLDARDILFSGSSKFYYGQCEMMYEYMYEYKGVNLDGLPKAASHGYNVQ